MSDLWAETCDVGGRDVRQVGHDDVPRVGVRRRQEVRGDDPQSIADGMPDGVLAGDVEGVGRDVDGHEVHVVRRYPALAQGDRHGDGDGPAARADVDDPDRLGERTAGGAREPGHDRGEGEVDELFGLRTRDEDPVVHGQGDPVELAHAPLVGDGFTGEAPLDERPVALRRHRRRPGHRRGR